MKAVQILEVGGPEKLVYKEGVEIPSPKEGEVLVKMSFASVNMVDTYFRKGVYPLETPFTTSCDGVGTITELGKGVEGYKVGDRVGLYTMGTCAEYCVAPVIKCYKVVEGVSDEVVCACMVNGLTAHYLTRSTYPVKMGDVVLVHAAAGGTGQLIVQICKILGATVIGTCSTPEKEKICKDLGVDHVINYKEKNFVDEVKEFCKMNKLEGCNVAFDGVGKATWEGSLESLATRGYLVLFGNASGVVPPIEPLRLCRAGSIFMTRPTLNSHVRTEEEKKFRIDELFGWIKDGKMKVRIHKVFGMNEVPDAHREIETRKTLGKIIIKIP